MNNTPVHVQLLLEGGHTQDFELLADAPQLSQMLQVLAARSTGSAGAPEQLIQLPLDGGKESFSFSSAQLVAVVTRPPVLIEFEQAEVAKPAQKQSQKQAQGNKGRPDDRGRVQRPRVMIIDNFLGHYEHQDMLAHALQQEQEFDPGTVVTGAKNTRKNLAVLQFATHAHSTLLCNRLLTWFPQITQTVGIEPFPIKQVESQLTASNDGHYYRAHQDADRDSLLDRVLTCVYYFSKQPAQFSGGGLRIYDSRVDDGGRRTQLDTFQDVAPVSNRMVIFLSDYHHELLQIRCPSRRFEDSRFAVTNWIWGTEESDLEATHGWGHMHCTKVSLNWLSLAGDDI